MTLVPETAFALTVTLSTAEPYSCWICFRSIVPESREENWSAVLVEMVALPLESAFFGVATKMTELV